MYSVDEKDCVLPLIDIPQSSVGAPLPVILGDEHCTVLAFYLQDTPDDWDGFSVRVVNYDTDGESLALIKFSLCYATMFGPPNDEAFTGHPLHQRGLTPYGAFVIENSSWLRQLEKMNSVHRYHDPNRFWAHNHYVLTFHDSTFECIADGYVIEEHNGSIEQILSRMITLKNTT